MVSPAVLLAAAALVGGRRDVRLLPPSGEAVFAPIGHLQPLGAGAEVLPAGRGGRWKAATAATVIRTGDRIRTLAEGGAELDLPWAVLVLGSSSSLAIAPSRVLTATLEEGRVEERALAHDIIHLRTAEGSVRGTGHVVVRRHGMRTAISALEGDFALEAPSGTVSLASGEGSILESGKPPAPAAPLPRSPITLALRGDDPLYAATGTPVVLRWTSETESDHIQLRVVPSDEVLFDGDVQGHAYSADLPAGLYRWRVSPVNASGLESLSRAEALLCFVSP